MKLVRFGEPGKERPGIRMDDGRILDVRAVAFHIEDFNAHFFERYGLQQLESLIRDPGARFVEGEGVRIGPPVAAPSKIICVGANYPAHAREFGIEQPRAPILFAKPPSAVNGPFDDIILPEGAKRVDSEVELAVVIGRRARNVSVAAALDYVAGYTILNDVTDRDAQIEDGQWFRAKGADTFCPIGPFLVTPDELGDISRLCLRQRLNGRLLQEGVAGDMFFFIAELIAYITRRITLLPGDIVATGTPPGIGSAQSPPVLMQPGDIVELEITGLGAQRCRVVGTSSTGQ